MRYLYIGCVSFFLLAGQTVADREGENDNKVPAVDWMQEQREQRLRDRAKGIYTRAPEAPELSRPAVAETDEDQVIATVGAAADVALAGTTGFSAPGKTLAAEEGLVDFSIGFATGLIRGAIVGAVLSGLTYQAIVTAPLWVPVVGAALHISPTVVTTVGVLAGLGLTVGGAIASFFHLRSLWESDSLRDKGALLGDLIGSFLGGAGTLRWLKGRVRLPLDLPLDTLNEIQDALGLTVYRVNQVVSKNGPIDLTFADQTGALIVPKSPDAPVYPDVEIVETANYMIYRLKGRAIDIIDQ